MLRELEDSFKDDNLHRLVTRICLHHFEAKFRHFEWFDIKVTSIYTITGTGKGIPLHLLFTAGNEQVIYVPENGLLGFSSSDHNRRQYIDASEMLYKNYKGLPKYKEAAITAFVLHLLASQEPFQKPATISVEYFLPGVDIMLPPDYPLLKPILEITGGDLNNIDSLLQDDKLMEQIENLYWSDLPSAQN